MFKRSKRLKTTLVVALIVVGLTLSFAAGCTINFLKPTTSQTQNPAQTIDLNLVNSGFNVIKDLYVEPAKIDGAKLTDGAIKGMVDALNDPHSAYLTKAQYQIMQSDDIEGKYGGIGAYVGITNGVISVIAPIPGTPAEKAGIQPGDLILEIDGKSTEGLNPIDASISIRGAVGTKVKLLVLHKDGSVPVTVEIARGVISVPSVNYKMVGSIADVQITDFTMTTNEEILPVLRAIADNGASGIILDLRNNPGGIVDVCVDVASHFIQEGVVISNVDRNGNKQTQSVTNTSVRTNLPIVVLVNQNSASAAEMLTGALKDHGRAVIAGTVTYGKGSTNNLIQISDGSAIYITVGRWLTPNGDLIEGKGIQPDQTVDFTKVDGIQWAIEYLNNNK